MSGPNVYRMPAQLLEAAQLCIFDAAHALDEIPAEGLDRDDILRIIDNLVRVGQELRRRGATIRYRSQLGDLLGRPGIDPDPPSGPHSTYEYSITCMESRVEISQESYFRWRATERNPLVDFHTDDALQLITCEASIAALDTEIAAAKRDERARLIAEKFEVPR